MPWRNTFHCFCEETFSHCLCILHCVCKHLQSNEAYFLFWHLFFIRCTQAWHMLCIWFSTVLCGDCFQPCRHVPTLFAVILYLFIAIFQSLVRLWAGQVGSEFPQWGHDTGDGNQGQWQGVVTWWWSSVSHVDIADVILLMPAELQH